MGTLAERQRMSDKDSPLRALRKSKGMTIVDLHACLIDAGYSVTIPTLSNAERGNFWPSRTVVDMLIEFFNGEIDANQIFYPFKSLEKNKND